MSNLLIEIFVVLYLMALSYIAGMEKVISMMDDCEKEDQE